MRTLVTGGAGFIGTRLVKALAAAGDEVVVLDSLRPDVHGPDALAPALERLGGVQLHHADLRDPAAVQRALDGVEAVAHLAGKVGLGVSLSDVEDYVSSNDLATAVLLRALAGARPVRRLVYASSMVVYGEGAYDCPEHGRVAPAARRTADLDAGRFEPPCPVCARPLAPALVTETATPDPRNTYAATKLHGEHLTATWARETGGAGAAMRFHNVYGPGMPRDTPYSGVAAIFRSALEAGRPPRVFEDGGQRRDFVHVDDVAAACVVALHSPRLPAGAVRAYNVGSGTVTTVGQMATALAAAVSGPAPVVSGEYRLGDVRHVTASSARLADELGWAPAVAFADGVVALATDPLRPAATSSRPSSGPPMVTRWSPPHQT